MPSKTRCPECGSATKKHSDEECDLAQAPGEREDRDDSRADATSG